MSHQSKAILFCTLIFALHATFALAQEVLDEREFDYIPGSNRGPENWGTIKPEWGTCRAGNLQSPVDMTDERVTLSVLSNQIVRSYKPGAAIAMNRGHDIMLEWLDDAGSVLINNTLYDLRQVHWHSPSEHTIHGKRFALELHMVHTSQDPNAEYKIAVVGRLYDVGSPDPFLSMLEPYLRTLLLGKNKTQAGVIDPTDIEVGDLPYFRYIGSLTVPPCTEGVLWTIKQRTMTASTKQIQLLREAVHDFAEQNARPLQPLHQRLINLFWRLI